MASRITPKGCPNMARQASFESIDRDKPQSPPMRQMYRRSRKQFPEPRSHSNASRSRMSALRPARSVPAVNAVREMGAGLHRTSARGSPKKLARPWRTGSPPRTRRPTDREFQATILIRTAVWQTCGSAALSLCLSRAKIERTRCISGIRPTRAHNHRARPGGLLLTRNRWRRIANSLPGAARRITLHEPRTRASRTASTSTWSPCASVGTASARARSLLAMAGWTWTKSTSAVCSTWRPWRGPNRQHDVRSVPQPR
jgi:hypothetical protein